MIHFENNSLQREIINFPPDLHNEAEMFLHSEHHRTDHESTEDWTGPLFWVLVTLPGQQLLVSLLELRLTLLSGFTLRVISCWITCDAVRWCNRGTHWIKLWAEQRKIICSDFSCLMIGPVLIQCCPLVKHDSIFYSSCLHLTVQRYSFVFQAFYFQR